MLIPRSTIRLFTAILVLTGAVPAVAAPAAPALAPTKAYSTFHPYEVMTFTWSGVAGASTYVLQASRDPSFPVSTAIQFDNIADTTYSFAIANPEGNYFARVFAVDANGARSQPSNTITFSVFFNNPIGPAPVSVSPGGGATLTLPITFTWNDVPNPQPSGYELQVARDSGFSKIEFAYNQFTDPTFTITSLTPGTKFWRVRSAQGNASPTTAAETAWSAVKSFSVSSAPPTPVSVTFTTDPLASGNTTWVQVQLTAAVSNNGATLALKSSNAAAAPVPQTVAVPPNTGWVQFQMQAGQVPAPTPAVITATLNGKSASGQLTVAPTSLKSLSISPSLITGGTAAWGIAMLTGSAPVGGATVTLASNSAAVSPPSSVFVNPGEMSVSFPIPTSAVTANTTATVTAAWDGVSTPAQVTLTPQQQPASIALSPTSTVGQSGGSFATVTIASPQSTDLSLQVTSSQPSIASVPPFVTIPAGSTTGGFNVFTSAVSANTVVTISVSGGGVTRSAALTVTPSSSPTPPPPAPSQSATLTVTASGRSGERVLSSPAGLSVAVGSTGSATFATGTSITLSVTNGRDAIWSGACSSGGSKRRTCTFTFNGNASATVTVQ